MPDTYYRIVADELGHLGFKRSPGGKGSHEKWRSEASGRRLIVPRKLKSRHTANGILEDAGSDKRV